MPMLTKNVTLTDSEARRLTGSRRTGPRLPSRPASGFSSVVSDHPEVLFTLAADGEMRRRDEWVAAITNPQQRAAASRRLAQQYAEARAAASSVLATRQGAPGGVAVEYLEIPPGFDSNASLGGRTTSLVRLTGPTWTAYASRETHDTWGPSGYRPAALERVLFLQLDVR